MVSGPLSKRSQNLLLHKDLRVVISTSVGIQSLTAEKWPVQLNEWES
jgi:hypothetical protein